MSTEAPEDDGSPSVLEGLWWVGFGALASFALVVVIGGAILSGGFGGSSDDASTDAAADDQELAVAGSAVYDSNCAVCHGAEGGGAAGPAFAGIVDRYPDVADQIAVVVNGRGGMPAFGSSLSEGEIEAVVAFERDTFDAGP